MPESPGPEGNRGEVLGRLVYGFVLDRFNLLREVWLAPENGRRQLLAVENSWDTQRPAGC